MPLRCATTVTSMLTYPAGTFTAKRARKSSYFPTVRLLRPVQSCTVGTQTTDSIVDYLWPDARVWHETKPDTAILYNAYGQEVSKLE